jgi:hypothetical protein
LYPNPRTTSGDRVIAVVEGAHASLSRHDLSAGPVVAVLAFVTVLTVLAVFALAYAMYLRDRR